MALRNVDTYLAYRLGDIPTGERTKEVEQLPSGPRISLSEAMQLRLPDGTQFCDASEKQISQWFEWLFEQAGVSKQVQSEIFYGLDLLDFDDRWWALNELLEISTVRDVFEGKPAKPVVERLPDAISHKQLAQIVEEYGMGVTQPRKPDGSAQVYAQVYTSVHRMKIYLCSLSALEGGQLTERKVRAKLEKRGLVAHIKQERKVA